MADLTYHEKAHNVLSGATLILTIERTPRYRFGMWLIMAAMWVGCRFMGMGFRVDR